MNFHNIGKGLKVGFCLYGTGDVSPFDQVFTGGGHALDPNNLKTFDGIDAIIVWGGADISPSIYKERVSRLTGARETLSFRDQYEVACVNEAIKRGLPIIGVCRGAQLACAMAGGKLVQHVENHGQSHDITTHTGEVMRTSSVHHQMMYPWDVEHELIAWSTEKRSRCYIGGDDEDMEHLHTGYVEPEIVFFPKIKALAIQGHPEFMQADSRFVQFCNELVVNYLLKEEVHG